MLPSKLVVKYNCWHFRKNIRCWSYVATSKNVCIFRQTFHFLLHKCRLVRQKWCVLQNCIFRAMHMNVGLISPMR